MVKDVDMDITEELALEREERLQRVTIRQQEFRVRKVCKNILEDVIMMVVQYRTVEMATTMVEQMADKAVEDARINRLLREADELGPDIRNRLEQKLIEQRLDEARAAMSLIEEEAREYRLEMMSLRQLTWMNEYLRRQAGV